MMHHASHGVRNAARKVSNGLIHGSGHNGPGSTNHTRSFHLESQIRNALHAPRSPPFSFGSVRTRNLSNKLFSASKNFLQRFFTHLTTPGFRAPFHPSQLSQIGTRSLHTGIRNPTIQNGLSFVSRQGLRNNVLQRQANTFLPRGPAQVQPRFGGIAQVGLGSARNFTTVRPIFENLVHNVPIAARALYEADFDTDVLKKQQKISRFLQKAGGKTRKTRGMQKQKQSTMKYMVASEEAKGVPDSQKSALCSIQDMDHFFPEIHDSSVTTYLLIPLAPTPTSRLPLDPNPVVVTGTALLPPFSDLGTIHATHLNHSLKVSTIFTRLDQAKVWETGGVSCSAYSQGPFHQRQVWERDKSDVVDEGVCTILKIKFSGWTKAQVRGVIGESGTGWCVLEEVYHEEHVFESGDTLETCSSISSALTSPQMCGVPLGSENEMHQPFVDPSESLILPTLDLIGSPSAPSISGRAGPDSIPAEMEVDPWNDASFPSSPLSSFSELSDLIVDPPSLNGWFETAMQSSYHAAHESEGIQNVEKI